MLKAESEMNILRNNSNRKQQSSNYCKIFCKTSKSYLKKHVNIVHKRTKYFTCNICNKKCSLTEYLKVHEQTVHEKLKTFKCDACKKKKNLVEKDI